MSEVWAAIIEVLTSTGANNLLTSVGIYVATPLLTYINIQFIKDDRTKRHIKKLGRWTLRGMAFVMCFGFALFLGWRVGDWSFDTSVDHAANIAVMYPLAMWGYMSFLKSKYPDAYRKLVVPRRRRRKTDNDDNDHDPDTTWEGPAGDL